jgi:hypothetical protein
MSQVVISGDTSGAITLAAPAVAGTNTITLPAATGTVMVSGNMPAFSATMSADQTIGTSATKITFNTKTGANGFDTNNNYDATTNYRFTPTVAGYYQINFSLSTVPASGAASGQFYFYIYKNGSSYLQQRTYYASAGNFLGCQLANVIYCNGSTDYIEAYASGVSQSMIIYSAYSGFSGAMVRSA